MKIRIGFVSNSSSCSFTIGNKSNKTLTIVDFVNENPIMNTRKPYYNILLDDRAGLDSSVYMLRTLLNNF